MINKIEILLSKPIFRNPKFILFVWSILALIAGLKHAVRGVFNDYLIFKSVFYHTIERVNLYLYYPELNGDRNHYGPFFSLVFAPFALLPDSLGTILWEQVMALVLFFAIYKLPLDWKYRVIILFICLQGVYANAVNSETNTLIAALIIGAFICIKKEHDFWAACFIALGTFVKLYSIVGFAFFFFSKHKIRLIGSFILWCILFFVLPMLISSSDFILQSYSDWYEALIYKNNLNANSINKDISVMGMVRRILDDNTLSNLVILISALVIFALQYIRLKDYTNLKYQLGILSSTLLFVVLFSSGSETSTYIIATVGIGIWFVIQPRPYSKNTIFLLIFVIVMVLASSGIMPRSIRADIVKAYALQALPFFIVWLLLVYQLVTGRLSRNTNATLGK